MRRRSLTTEQKKNLIIARMARGWAFRKDGQKDYDNIVKEVTQAFEDNTTEAVKKYALYLFDVKE